VEACPDGDPLLSQQFGSFLAIHFRNKRHRSKLILPKKHSNPQFFKSFCATESVATLGLNSSTCCKKSPTLLPAAREIILNLSG
jgi:hypothetical protein